MADNRINFTRFPWGPAPALFLRRTWRRDITTTADSVCLQVRGWGGLGLNGRNAIFGHLLQVHHFTCGLHCCAGVSSNRKFKSTTSPVARIAAPAGFRLSASPCQCQLGWTWIKWPKCDLIQIHHFTCGLHCCASVSSNPPLHLWPALLRRRKRRWSTANPSDFVCQHVCAT